MKRSTEINYLKKAFAIVFNRPVSNKEAEATLRIVETIKEKRGKSSLKDFSQIAAALLLMCTLWLSCSPKKPLDSYSKSYTEVEAYVNLKFGEVAVVKIKDCEYVFWDYYRGSDMEHYAGCTNAAHCNSVSPTSDF